MDKLPMPDSLIAISGKQYAGKDVLTHLLLAHLPFYRQTPLAYGIKTEFARLNGLTLEAIEADKAHYRPGLIILGQKRRAEDPDYWIHQVLAIPGPKIISDMRMRTEYAVLHAAGAFCIRLDADRSIRVKRGTLVKEDDITECDLDGLTDWDAVLTNNGSVDALEAQVVAILPTVALRR